MRHAAGKPPHRFHLLGLSEPLLCFDAGLVRLLALFPREAGAAAGLAVTGQFALGAACSALVGALSDGSPWPMCLVVGCAGLGCLLAFLLARRHAPQPSPEAA